jgi:transposase
VDAHARKKPGRKPLPPELPRVEVVIDLPEDEKVCGYGCTLSRIGEEVSEQLDIIPAKIQVIRQIRPKNACRQREGIEDAQPVRIAPVPARIIPKSIATPGLLAHVLTGKFVDHMPFYRQEKMFARLGVDIGRATLCNWAMQVATACLPLINLISDAILEGRVINIDETTLQVLAEPGREATAKSYMWVFRRGDPHRPAIIYQYHPTRAGDVQGVSRRLQGRHPDRRLQRLRLSRPLGGGASCRLPGSRASKIHGSDQSPGKKPSERQC